jgi:hypothetical protein
VISTPQSAAVRGSLQETATPATGEGGSQGGLAAPPPIASQVPPPGTGGQHCAGEKEDEYGFITITTLGTFAENVKAWYETRENKDLCVRLEGFIKKMHIWTLFVRHALCRADSLPVVSVLTSTPASSSIRTIGILPQRAA